jgi:hypothetical protein
MQRQSVYQRRGGWLNDRETGLEGNTRGPSVSGPADFLRRHGTVLLFVGIYFAIGAWTLTGMHDWGGDFSLYIAEARAIAENGTIVEPDYVHLGRLSPVTYPPGLPLLLAPVYAMFGLDFQMLKLPPIRFPVSRTTRDLRSSLPDSFPWHCACHGPVVCA